MKRILGLLVLIFGLSACKTKPLAGVLLTETPSNMSLSRQVITTVIGKPREISENGRELFSEYYDSNGLDFNPGRSRERFYTHILILGDRRPYDIRVIVPIEEKIGSKYVEVGDDKERAKKVAEKIKKALHESRDNRNLIDDFKPY